MRALAQFMAPHVGPAVLHERRKLVGASATGVTRSLWALEKWSFPQQRMFAISFNMWWNLLSRPFGMLGSEGLGKHRWSRPGPRRGPVFHAVAFVGQPGPSPPSARHVHCFPGASTCPAAGKARSRPFRVGLSSLCGLGGPCPSG